MISRKPHGISISLKIFGIATSMLGLLIVVVCFSSYKLRRVNLEITALAKYIIPISDRVAQVGIHALEQELYFERILKLYEIEPLNRAQIEQEEAQFNQRGDRIDQKLAQAEQLTQKAIAHAKITANEQEWVQIMPMLAQIKQKHQEFHDYGTTVFKQIEAGESAEALQLEAGLKVKEGQFNQEIAEIVLKLEDFTTTAAHKGQNHQQQVQQLSLIVALFTTGFGLCYASIVTFGVVKPIRRLTQSTRAIEQGNLDVQVKITTRDEIGNLERSFNLMVDELKLKKKLEDTFGKYVDPRVVKSLMNTPTSANTEGERQNMTVLFADVEGFSAMTETLPADALVKITNQYLTLMSAPISAHSGVIDKFIGTTVMAFWGSPFTSETEQAYLACYAALDQVVQLKQLFQLIPRTSNHSFSLHIGIATGSLVVGNMGSESAKSYTVMGDTVNIASRLKGVSKQYGVPIILTQETRNMAVKGLEFREIDWVQVVGKQEPVGIYELLGRKAELSSEMLALRDFFEQGLNAYRQQNWKLARQCFENCLQIQSSDRPTQLYLERLQTLQENPPPKSWNGVWRLTKK
ncbi:MAG: HAMP domain-containing protein [Desertifilum sp. SIO1I2]|nr:HAMP domain-containing protein [Desertifilum sp. SIO1I2]